MESSNALPACTDDVIESLVDIACGENASSQARHLYRESLRNLVRMAKAEHLQHAEPQPHRVIYLHGERALH